MNIEKKSKICYNKGKNKKIKMYYDFQIIKALDWSTAAQAFWEKEKKEIYDFSQSISPDLKKI